MVSPSFDFAQDIREKPFALPVPGRVGPGRLSKGRTACSASGSGSAPEGLLPRRESLWLGEDRPCRTMNGTLRYSSPFDRSTSSRLRVNGVCKPR
ncbi:MAG: hypothetical protein Q7V12_10670 [Deltaproteobacteria bacterium]|nr:hypothetical protein [Deltaproteobacteria bacterium]